MPGSPGLQAISFNTSCEIEIARNLMQAAGQVRERRSGGESGRSNGDFAPPRVGFRLRPDKFMLNVCPAGAA
jgi:hypothetical protein